MGKLTNYGENELLDHVLVATYSRPANWYISLCTADPGEAATGANITEPAGNGYSRKAIDANWDAAARRATANSAAVTFDEATGSWGTITHFAIVDSSSGAGNVIAYGEISPNKAITSGMNASIAIGDLDISWDASAPGGISDYLANKLLDHVFKGDAYSKPTNTYVCALDENAVDGDSGTDLQAKEPTGVGSYARKLNNGWDAASGGLVDNTAAITFVTATASWTSITHFAITDHLTVGNILFLGSLATLRQVASSDVLEFPAGALDLTMD